MQDHLKYQRSLARKSSNRKPTVTAASGSQPAVSSSPVGPSIPLTPAVSESSQLQDAVLAVLQSLKGSLGINLNPSPTAPSSVPSGVGALELPAQSSQISPSPIMHSDNVSVLRANARCYVGMGTVTAADRSAPIGPSPSPVGSSGADQLQANIVGPLASSSSALSPNSLLLPFLLPYLPLFLLFLRGRPIPLTPLLFPLFWLRSPLLPRLPFLLFLLLSLLLPWLRPLSRPLPLFPPPFLFPLLTFLRLLLLLPPGLILLFILLPLSIRLLFLLPLRRSLPFPIFLLLMVSLLPLSLPGLLRLPPLFLLFLLLQFRHLLPLPLFSQFLFPRLVGFLLPLPFLFPPLLPLPLGRFLPWRTTRRAC